MSEINHANETTQENSINKQNGSENTISNANTATITPTPTPTQSSTSSNIKPPIETKLPMKKIAKSFHSIWNKPLSESYVARDFSRLANKFSVEVEKDSTKSSIIEVEIPMESTFLHNDLDVELFKNSTPDNFDPSILIDQHLKSESDKIQSSTIISNSNITTDELTTKLLNDNSRPTSPSDVIFPDTNSTHPKDVSSSENLLKDFSNKQSREPSSDVLDASSPSKLPETEYHKLLFRASVAYDPIDFRRSDENQSTIIVEDLNIVSELLNSDFIENEESNEENNKQNQAILNQAQSEKVGQEDFWEHREPLIDIDAFNDRVYTLNDSKPLTTFLLETFNEKSSRTMKILKCCDQAFVVCLLGYLGMILFSVAGIRFKDIRPSTWRVIVRKHKDNYSVIHRRTELSLKVDPTTKFKFIELCKFTWEVEIVFDSKSLNYIDAVHVRILNVDWSNCDQIDTEHENHIRNAFEDSSITNLNFHLESDDSKKQEVKASSNLTTQISTQKSSKKKFFLGCIKL